MAFQIVFMIPADNGDPYVWISTLFPEDKREDVEDLLRSAVNDSSFFSMTLNNNDSKMFITSDMIKRGVFTLQRVVESKPD